VQLNREEENQTNQNTWIILNRTKFKYLKKTSPIDLVSTKKQLH
jgi:hypothetical protein